MTACALLAVWDQKCVALRRNFWYQSSKLYACCSANGIPWPLPCASYTFSPFRCTMRLVGRRSPVISKFRHTPARKSQNQGYLFTLHLHSILLRAGADAETNTPSTFASLCGRARIGQLANSRLRNYTMPRTHTRMQTRSAGLGFVKWMQIYSRQAFARRI